MSPHWRPFTDDGLECAGLAWLEQNESALWRMPQQVMSSLPKGVQTQARFAAGARLQVRTDSSALHLRLRLISGAASGLDLYVDGAFWRTLPVPVPVPGSGHAEVDVECYSGAARQMRRIEIYLPLRHELQIEAWAIDEGAQIAPDPAHDTPLVLYGSSVAQGIGAARPGLSYAARLGRLLDRTLVNLGFGGAGKAEPDVVDLVQQIEASCYLLDLGKSYGRQDAGPYTALIRTLREAHPPSPVLCITPIYSSRGLYEPGYDELTRHTQDVVRQACATFDEDELVQIVEGESLLSATETDHLTGDGVHPNDLGHTQIAAHLLPRVRQILGTSNPTSG
jgi:hypothetical protein